MTFPLTVRGVVLVSFAGWGAGIGWWGVVFGAGGDFFLAVFFFVAVCLFYPKSGKQTYKEGTGIWCWVLLVWFCSVFV